MELIILIGIAGSGKTTFCKKIFPNHVHISLDEIQDHSRQIEFKTLEENLASGNDIIIDDTNLTKSIREQFISKAKKYNSEIKGVFFDLSMSRIQMQNSKREKPLPDSVLFKQKKRLESPSKDEGFDFIQNLNDVSFF